MKKNLKTIIILFSVVLLSLPLIASAEGFGFGVLSQAAIWFLNGIALVFSAIIGLFVQLGGALTDFALSLNINYLHNSELVNTGWGISRDIANLGFVLAIILIAFATIIQYQSYGAKKMLPKLIAAALLVNFSMAIAKPILGFSDTATMFFLGGKTQGVSRVIAGAFSPQRLLMGQGAGDEPTAPDVGGETGAFSGFGDAVMLGLANILFVIVFTTITAIAFFALAFMLMIRYVYLSILLIIAPMAWLAWVIPGLERQFSAWWSNFFKWAFFAPLVSFFIYLALTGAEQLGSQAQTIGVSFSGSLAGIMSQGGQMVIMCGLMLGGLMAAQQMGIKGAAGAIGIAKQMGNWGTKVVGRKAKQWGTAPLRKKFGTGEEKKSLADRTQSWAQKGGLRGMVGKVFVRPVSDLAATGGEKLIKEHEKAAENLTVSQAKARLATAKSDPQIIALLNKLVASGQLDKELASKYVTEKNKNRFAGFGQEKEFKKLTTVAGMNPEMNEALKSNNATDLKKGSDKYIKGVSKNNAKDMPWNTVFRAVKQGKGALGFDDKKTKQLAESLSSSLVSENPQMALSIIPTLDSAALDSFSDEYTKALDDAIGKAKTANDSKETARLAKIKNGFDKSIAKQMGGV